MATKIDLKTNLD